MWWKVAGEGLKVWNGMIDPYQETSSGTICLEANLDPDVWIGIQPNKLMKGPRMASMKRSGLQDSIPKPKWEGKTKWT